jgi:hypothetical protein
MLAILLFHSYLIPALAVAATVLALGIGKVFASTPNGQNDSGMLRLDRLSESQEQRLQTKVEATCPGTAQLWRTD